MRAIPINKQLIASHCFFLLPVFQISTKYSVNFRREYPPSGAMAIRTINLNKNIFRFISILFSFSNELPGFYEKTDFFSIETVSLRKFISLSWTPHF